jgi:ribosomal protein S18 acetylase RimI-like enzyme
MVFSKSKAILLVKEEKAFSIPDLSPQIKEKPLEINQVEQPNLSFCCDLTGIEVNEGQRRISAGDSCFVATRGSDILGLVWVHRGSFYIRGLGYYSESVDNDHYLYNLVVLPKYRREGVAKRLVQTIEDLLSTKSNGRVLAIVEKNNLAGLSFFKSLQYEPEQSICHLKLCFLNYTGVKTVPEKGNNQRRLFWNPPKGVFVI